MEASDRERLATLLLRGGVGALSVLVDGKPYVGLVPFALTAEGTGLLVHVSRLARHSAGLGLNAPYSLLIHEPEGSRPNPQQLARVSLQGTSRPLERGSDEWAAGKARYLAKYPKSEITFGLGDFDLVGLGVTSARFIAGFAKTWELSPGDLQGLAEGG